MKDIKECINQSLISESADKAYKELFGKLIVLSPALSSKFSKLKVDWRHKEDKFVVYEDGRLTYENPRLFTGTMVAKVNKNMLNRTVNNGDIKFLEEPTSCATLDMSTTPYRYIRAVFDALTHRAYQTTMWGVTITDLDYTSGDYDKDRASND